MFCPICYNESTKTLIEYSDFPYFAVPLDRLTKKKILNNKKIKKTDQLQVKICNNCFHGYLSKLPDKSTLDFLYKDYFGYPSPLEGHFKPERDIKFLEIFKNNIHSYCKKNNLLSILEVGCFDGYILYHLKKMGYDVMGCDPSEGAKIGREFGLNIKRDYFDADQFVNDNLLFDVVISRHFIEHVVDPKLLLESFKKVLSPNGVIIIETPNVESYIKKGTMDVFSLEHIHAFSSNSLKYLASTIDMMSVKLIKSEDNLIYYTKSGKNKFVSDSSELHNQIQNYNKKLSMNLKKIMDICNFFKSKNKKICLWGAGSSGSTALSFYGIPINYIDFIIDSDSKKWNMEYISHSIPIISPDQGKINNPDLIIITSMYSETIEKNIKEIGFNSSILSIHSNVTFSEN